MTGGGRRRRPRRERAGGRASTDAHRHGRGAAVDLPARRRDHHADHHGAAGVHRRRPRRARHRPQPDRAPTRRSSTAPGSTWFFPWIDREDRVVAALNLQQTLLTTTPLILTGLAVAFAFRCGLFNIGGQGQYLVGTFFAVWVGSSFAAMPRAAARRARDGRARAGRRGVGRRSPACCGRRPGANEVISTIMLNWIAVWIGVFLFGLGGPLQSDTDTSVPVSNDIVEGAKLPVFWGDAAAPGPAHRPVHRARRWCSCSG